MAERDYGYVATAFSGKSIEPFQQLTKRLCGEKDFYASDTVGYVNGDVSSGLHMTLFYGLIDENIDKDKFNDYIKGIQLPTLELGKLVLRQEYNKFCQILWVQVLDQHHVLERISEGFKQFEYEKSVQLGFVPHLTLAYVKNEYTLEDIIPEYPHEIEVEELKYFEQ